jgi:hypothetical protein
VFFCVVRFVIATNQEIEMTEAGYRAATQITVEAMLDQIGLLRKLVAIDSMPLKLQQVRQLLRELNAELDKKA